MRTIEHKVDIIIMPSDLRVRDVKPFRKRREGLSTSAERPDINTLVTITLPKGVNQNIQALQAFAKMEK